MLLKATSANQVWRQNGSRRRLSILGSLSVQVVVGMADMAIMRLNVFGKWFEGMVGINFGALAIISLLSDRWNDLLLLSKSGIR